MSRLGKRIEKWRNPAFRQDVPKNEIESILDKYFPGEWTYGEAGGSHNYKITSAKFKGHPNFGPGGDFIIPVKGGQKIKPVYIKQLISIIDDLGGDE